MWLVRSFKFDEEEEACDANYLLDPGIRKPTVVDRKDYDNEFTGYKRWSVSEAAVNLCPRWFHKHVPNIRLKPGKGPMKVTVIMKELK